MTFPLQLRLVRGLNPTLIRARYIHPKDVVKWAENGECLQFGRGDNASVATALSLDAIEVVVERVSVARKGLVKNIGVEIVPTESALPSEIQKQAEKDGATGEVEGVLHKGTVYIVADKMTSEAHVEEVLLHEAAGHQGGRWLFGKDVSQAYNKLYLMLGSKGVKEVAARHGVNC